MLIGITLKHYGRLLAQGDNAKGSKLTEYLLTKKSNKRFKTRDIENISMSDFVDLERYLEESDFYNFCRIFVCNKFWQTVYVHNLELIVQDFADQKAKLFERNYYIFDPPIFGESTPDTVGDELRADFVREFGNYVVLMDKVQKWDKSGYKNVEKWKVSEFFFWANYLEGQLILEKVK